MLLEKLLEGVSCSCENPENIEITGITNDSRGVKPGSLFICLCGSSVDSHAFAGQAAAAGAAAILAQKPVEHGSAALVLVEDTRAAMAQVAAAWYGHPADRMAVIGITGTKGKTTTTYMIRSILEAGGIQTGVIGTIGAAFGETLIPTENTTPDSCDVQKFLCMMADAGCRAVVMEASSIGLRDHRLDGFSFDYGVFTNFSPDHIGGKEHRDLSEYMACKSLLFRRCRTGIFNIDDENWRGVAEGHTCAVETYGFSPEAQLRASGEALIARPGYIGAHFELSGRETGGVDVRIPGRFSVYNALAAIAVCLHFPIGMDAVRKGLDTVSVKGRVEPVAVPGNYTLLIDYAHNALAMENILTTLREYHPHRLVCMFGAGGNRARSRRFEMGEVSGRLADLSVVTADNSRFEDVMDIIADIEVGLKKTDGKYVVIPDRKQAIQYCMEHAEDGDIVVLAGKGHEDYQEIRGVKYPFDEREVVAEILAGKI